jgi:hypothetical protein
MYREGVLRAIFAVVVVSVEVTMQGAREDIVTGYTEGMCRLEFKLSLKVNKRRRGRWILLSVSTRRSNWARLREGPTGRRVV